MLPSVFHNEQELLKAVTSLHGSIELDPMYSKGTFYKDIKRPRYTFDINPEEGTEWGNAKRLPLISNTISCMILDPPFLFGIHGKTKEYSGSKRFGILQDFLALQELYQGILIEAKRVLKPKGTLFFKCQDYTDSKTTMTHCLVWKWATDLGFYAKDLAVLNLKIGRIWNPNLTQRHLRKTHCYLWTFKNATI